MKGGLICYFFHRSRHTVVTAASLPWPLELLTNYEWWCPSCDRYPGRPARVMRLSFAGGWAG